MKYIEKNGKKIDIILMNSFTKKLVGLMFKKAPIKEAYLFKNTNGIHTFFMRQNINVLLLSKDYKILKVIKNLKPWKVIMPKKNVKYTIELPVNITTFIEGETLTIKEK